MNRIKKPAGGQPTGKTEGRKNERVSSPNCTLYTIELSSPDYLALMRQAKNQADYLAAFTSFLSEIEVNDG